MNKNIKARFVGSTIACAFFAFTLWLTVYFDQHSDAFDNNRCNGEQFRIALEKANICYKNLHIDTPCLKDVIKLHCESVEN